MKNPTGFYQFLQIKFSLFEGRINASLSKFSRPLRRSGFFSSNGNLIKQSNGLEFLYDHTGIFALKHSGSTYFYRKNAQNDVISILDTNGNTVVKYKYSAWGKCVIDASTTNTELANLNPFRYRSYYYDIGIGLYFLKTRYYDPEIGRFMTIDDISYLDPESINGLNLYAYCGNNPVMGYDPNGTWDWGSFWRALGSALLIAGGIALCFVPGAQAIGAGLIIAGTGGLIGGAIGHATGYGFNAGWDIGTVIGGFIGLAVAAPQLLALTFNASIPFLVPMLTTAGELVLVGTTVSVAIPVGGAIAVTAGTGLVYMAYESKKAAPRIKSNTKKQAYDKAFQKGGKKEPTYHPHGKFGPHYHPANPKFKHWHYYFSLILGLFGIELDNLD